MNQCLTVIHVFCSLWRSCAGCVKWRLHPSLRRLQDHGDVADGSCWRRCLTPYLPEIRFCSPSRKASAAHSGSTCHFSDKRKDVPAHRPPSRAIIRHVVHPVFSAARKLLVCVNFIAVEFGSTNLKLEYQNRKKVNVHFSLKEFKSFCWWYEDAPLI